MTARFFLACLTALTLTACSTALIFPVDLVDLASATDLPTTRSDLTTPPIDFTLAPDMAEKPDLLQCNGRWTPMPVFCGPNAKPGDTCDDGIEATPNDACAGPNDRCTGGNPGPPFVLLCRTSADCCGSGISGWCVFPNEGYFATGACLKGMCELTLTKCPAGQTCDPKKGCL